MEGVTAMTNLEVSQYQVVGILDAGTVFDLRKLQVNAGKNKVMKFVWKDIGGV